MFLVLLVIGLLMVYLEFFLPGAILGTIGGILLLASVVLFFQESHSPLFAVLYLIAVLGSLAAVIKYALWKISQSKSKSGFYSRDAQVGYYASTFDPEMIGKEGIVITDLKPGGYILVEGKQVSAISESGYIGTGEKVRVLQGEGDSLIVTKG